MKESRMANPQAPQVSIILLAFNHLDYTKLCVESLYRFTSHLPFELITVNNGSSDATEQFFNTLPHQKKINFPHNVGGDTAINEGLKLADGKYTVFLSNDLILTPHWLDNLLKCMEAGGKIGMVVPACGASSNYQQVGLQYNSMDEMLQKAAAYNHSDPRKWEERLRLITYTFLIRTDLFKAMGGLEEIYNPGGFDDDDLSFRIRRAGYKLIFAKDTFVHHFGSITFSQDYAKLNLLERNRQIFFNKFGIDSWEDCHIDFEIVNAVQYEQDGHKDILALCTSCGGTALQVKNRFQEYGFTDIALWTLTENRHYLPDLKTISDHVVYGPFKNIETLCQGKAFDYIFIEGDLQDFENPEIFLQAVIRILRANGQLLFTVANEAFYLNLFQLLNGNVICRGHRISRSSFNMEKIYDVLVNEGFSHLQAYYSQVSIPAEHRPFVDNLKNISPVENKQLLEQIYAAQKVLFSAKGKAKKRNVLFYPGYDFWLNDRVFSDNNIGVFLGVDTGENVWAVLKDELAKHAFHIRTIDKGSIAQSEYIIFCDAPKSYQNEIFKGVYHQVCRSEKFFQDWLKSGMRSRMVLVLLESPFVMPENYDKSLHEYAALIFTYADDWVDNRKYFKIFYPQPLPPQNPYTVHFAEKKMYVMVAGNKFSPVTGQLYSERRKAIEYFDGKSGEVFDLYGAGWEGCGYQCYKGRIEGKLAVLSQYKYCICYENGAVNGYITEKIFDCFFAGCVPVYLGAPNVTEYIPANTFIDARRFADYEEMHRYIGSIDESEYNTYLSNIKQFLYSDAFQKFTYTHFAHTLLRIMEKNYFNNG